LLESVLEEVLETFTDHSDS